MGFNELISQTDDTLEMLQLCADSGLLSEREAAKHAKAVLKAQKGYEKAKKRYEKLGSVEYGVIMPKKKKRKNPLWWIKG